MANLQERLENNVSSKPSYKYYNNLFVYSDSLQVRVEQQGMNMQDYLCELMSVYQSYHDFASQHYVVRGSIIKCRYGTDPVLLDTIWDHGVYMHDIPVMTRRDCRNENIHNFGSCMCPESMYEHKLPMPAFCNSQGKVAQKAEYNKFPHTCVPLIDVKSGWQQEEQSLKIVDGEEVEDVLIDTAALVCRYGGFIQIVDVIHVEEKKKPANTYKKYVVIPKALRVRSTPTTENDNNILRKLEAGNRVEVIGDFIKQETDEGVQLWAKIKYEDGTAWVAADQILPDKPVERIEFPEQVTMYINGQEYDTVTPLSNWFIAGSGAYDNTPLITKYKEGNEEVNRYNIAIGPKIINPNYPDGDCILDEDFLAYNRKVDVEIDDNGETKVLPCHLYSFKAHSYNLYPDGHESHDYDKVEVDYENGVVQTGIRYPHARKGSELSIANFDGSIVEFCSDKSCINTIQIEKKIQSLKDCKLKKITVYFKEEILWS